MPRASRSLTAPSALNGVALLGGLLLVACSNSSACPVFTASCIAGDVPTDTDGDGCVDACRPAPSDGAAPRTTDAGHD